MLYLNPPYFVINGVSVFPDHEDPLQYYFLPMMPHLTTDGAGSAMRPRLQMIEYTGAAGTGGFLNFDVNLGIDDATLKDVANELQRKAGLASTPRLSPVTFVDGSVKLLILGAQSPDPAAPSTGGSQPKPAASPAGAGPQFVLKIQNAAKPSLYGDNQATFSVQLDQDGVTIMQQALKGSLAPIAVIYALDFVGLRPAIHVHMSIDWNRVQKYLDDHFADNFLFVSTDIEKSVDSLIESQAISIQVDTFVTDSDLGTTSGADRDRAVAECYELVKNNFFESSVQPPAPDKPDGWDKAVDTFKSISEMAMTGGWGRLASFSRKHIDLSKTDSKHLDFDVSERTAVQRTIYPQGHLSGLLAALQQPGNDYSQYIVKVDLDNPYFQRRQVSVFSHADFDGDSIASIDVTMTYNTVVQSVSITAGSAPTLVSWTSLLVNGNMSRPVSYAYSVNFKNVDTTQRPGVLTTGTLTEIGEVIDIEPRNVLYGITVIPVRADYLPWNRYNSVEIECRYVDPANNVNLQVSAVLTSQTPDINWPLFLRDLTRRSFDYRLTYRLASGGVSVTPWTTTADGKLDIDDPFPSKLQLTVLTALDWTIYNQVLVFVAYPDKNNPAVQESYTFTAANNVARLFEVDRQDASRNLIYYEVRLIKNNGQLWTVPGSVTSDGYLIIQDGMKGHQVISVMSQNVDFSVNHIVQINVQLRYVDLPNCLNVLNQYVLSAASDVESFAYDYLNAGITPEYRADIQLDNGQTKSLDWSPVHGNSVTIPLDRLA